MAVSDKIPGWQAFCMMLSNAFNFDSSSWRGDHSEETIWDMQHVDPEHGVGTTMM